MKLCSPSSLAPWVAAAALTLAPRPAPAYPTAPQRAAARQHYERAVTHFNLGEFADAAAEFREVYKAAPQAALLYDAAQAYRLANDRDKALFFYQSYLRSEPTTPHRDEIEKRIRELSPNAPPAPATVPPAESKPGVPIPAKAAPSSPDVKPTVATLPDATPSWPDAQPAPTEDKPPTAAGTGGSERLRPVTDLIRKNRAGFRGCFDRWGSKHPGAGGTVTLTFYLDPDGNFDNADAESKGFDAPDVLDCIIGYAHSLHYPAAANGKFTRFTSPFDFKPAR
jgi:tetratricopeptide (TPR) repeat protein